MKLSRTDAFGGNALLNQSSKNEFGYLAMTEFDDFGALSLPNEGGWRNERCALLSKQVRGEPSGDCVNTSA